MLLLIPAMEIRSGRCGQLVLGVEGRVYSDDPVTMAKLWRTENAKSLHVSDLDGRRAGRVVHDELIRHIVASVDIPVELGGDLRTYDAVAQALSLGLYRVVVGTMVIEHPEEAQRCLAAFGPSKVVLGIDAVDGIVSMRGAQASTGLTAVTVALNARTLGFRRMLYTELREDGTLRVVNFDMLRTLGQNTGMRITAAGGITGLEDLLRIQELSPFGVDSVVIGRALYDNRFSCQQLWRRCEAGNYPYTARV
jgi:phosphoribosylformimino-5-aminoimidazole carboxamide ribotide isomerase